MTRIPERRGGRSDDDLRQQRHDDEGEWQATNDRGVLLVDCIPDEQEVYGEMFRHAGLEPVILCEAPKAFDTAITTRARVIVVDLTMTNAGLELIRQLRADARTRHSTIIVVSGRVSPADRAVAERAGCDVFLPKPCLPDTLLSEVRRTTERPDTDRRD